VDAVVLGIGTGATLVGLYQGFAEAGCNVRPVVARPVVLITEVGLGGVECCSFSTCIPGVVDSLSKLFVPEALPGLETIEVPDGEALTATRELIRLGFPVGPSSGLNYHAAQQVASRLPAGAQVVTVFPDRMKRYFSTELFTASL